MNKKIDYNVLAYFQDKSVYSILSYVLQKNNINLINFENFSKSNYYNTPISLILLDSDIGSKNTNSFLTTCKVHFKNSSIFLAISKNYQSFLQKQLPSSIKGIIYKPFDVQELNYIIKNSCSHVYHQ